MIRYPILDEKATIGITAPSSGLPEEMHDLLESAIQNLKDEGYSVVSGDTAWTQEKAKSASARKRAEEFNEMMRDESIGLIFPPWGGELLIETLEYIDFDNIREKWILGYSDISLLLLAITLNRGIATAHGTNLIDLRGEESDETTRMWKSVLSNKEGDTVIQYSSERYQEDWDFDNPTPHIFNLTEETYWKTVSGHEEKLEGRLLGGSMDAIRHLIGTSFGDIHSFRKEYIQDEPILWYLENCEMSVVELRRTLVHMKLAGWFKDASAIMFGRSSSDIPVEDYTVQDVYQELSEELGVPIVYDIDCGHMPPQITFINGAYAEVEVKAGNGVVSQTFR